MLHHFFCIRQVYYKTLNYSMKNYVLLHFEHKNDVTIIIRLHRDTRLRLVALYKSRQKAVAFKVLYYFSLESDLSLFNLASFKQEMVITISFKTQTRLKDERGTLYTYTNFLKF